MKVGIIGLGRVGAEFSLDEKRGQLASHVSCYNADPRVDSIACCDVDSNKVTNALKQIDKPKEAYTNYKQMMVEFQPQIVSICTPTPTHAEITCNVAKHDCVTNILLEKPISQTLAEAEVIIEACKGKRLMINYARRWSKLYRDTFRICRFGSSIGWLSITGVHPGPVLRTGTHMIDLFNWAFEWSIPETVQAFSKPTLAPYMSATNDYCLNGVINYRDGTAILLGQEMPYLQFELDMRFKDSRVIIGDNGLTKKTYLMDDSENYSKLKELSFAEHLAFQREPLLMNAIGEAIGTASMRPEQTVTCKAPFYELAPKTLPNSCPGEAGADALLVALGLHYSATHGNCLVKLSDVPQDYSIRSY